MKDKKTSVSAIIGLVFAILALPLSLVPIVNNFAFVLAILGLVFGIIAAVKIKKGKRSGKGISVATIVVSVISILLVLVSQQIYSDVVDQAGDEINESVERSTGERTDEILGNDVTVELGKFSTETDEYGLSKTELPVTVTNKLDEGKSYSVQIEAIDSDGKRIVEDYVYANDLGAKQEQDFKVFEYVEDDKLEAMKNAEFKIVSVSQS